MRSAVKAAAKAAGAFGCTISGAGPTCVAVTANEVIQRGLVLTSGDLNWLGMNETGGGPWLHACVASNIVGGSFFLCIRWVCSKNAGLLSLPGPPSGTRSLDAAAAPCHRCT